MPAGRVGASLWLQDPSSCHPQNYIPVNSKHGPEVMCAQMSLASLEERDFWVPVSLLAFLSCSTPPRPGLTTQKWCTPSCTACLALFR